MYTWESSHASNVEFGLPILFFSFRCLLWNQASVWVGIRKHIAWLILINHFERYTCLKTSVTFKIRSTVAFLRPQVYGPTLIGEGGISLSDIIESDDGLLKGALSSGDLKETVEIISSVSSILNFMERQDEQEEQGGNLDEEATKSKEKRKEV